MPRDLRTHSLTILLYCSRSVLQTLQASILAPDSSLGSKEKLVYVNMNPTRILPANMLTTESKIFSTD